MLEIIEHEKGRVANIFRKNFFKNVERRLAANLPDSESLNDGRWDRARIGERRQLHEVNTAGKLFGQVTGNFGSETRFADAAVPGDGYEANAGAGKKTTRRA